MVAPLVVSVVFPAKAAGTFLFSCLGVLRSEAQAESSSPAETTPA